MITPRAAAFLLLVFFLLPLAIFARDITIIVEDEELSLPLEGAVVSLRNGQQFACDEDGVALVTLPDERQTIVQITYPGYDTIRMTIPAAQDGAGPEQFTASLRLGGVMQNRELVLEAARPETSETRIGRSVAISDRDLARTAEIGIIEDVMSSVKLLPGVGYTGIFGAQPSIRGGDPGDLMIAFDGFYLENPYHWIGAVSIFDPKMVSSARLSHGVFSSRYGHSISGLLEINSKSPSPTEVEMETAVSTSATSLNLSLPINGKGGILFMGRVTYWDTLILTAQGLSKIIENETLDQINYITTSPYIRSAAVAANYRFTPDLDWRLNAFFGSDGVGAKFNTDYTSTSDSNVQGDINVIADYDNYQGFLISGITASPSPVVALKATAGLGFNKTITDDTVESNVTVKYNQEFLDKFPTLTSMFGLSTDQSYVAPGANVEIELDQTIFTAQTRADVDWDLGNGFIAAFGVQELYSRWAQRVHFDMSAEIPLVDLPSSEYADAFAWVNSIFPPGILPEDTALIYPISFGRDLYVNHGLTSSIYGLIEYSSPNQRFGAELGLRVDHLYFKGNNFSAQTLPALNPRLNLDFNILKNRGILDSLDFTIGSGLFSSINQYISYMEPNWVVNDDYLKFNRSWTSIAGVKVDVARKYSFNIEGYYKYIFDRAYITADILQADGIEPAFYFDGVGHVGGFDLQLQKLESRYIDGWISYTFTWAKYKDPYAGGLGISNNSVDTVDDWYYPSFHRFHNANIVLNIKPSQRFHIYNRFGFASGQEQTRTTVYSEIYSYPVIYIDDNGEPIIVQKYRRDTLETVTERAAWALSWDLKFSFFRFDRKGRVSTEFYFAAENLMEPLIALLDTSSSGVATSFNQYTGTEYTSGTSGGGFNLPIPLISFGVKWRY